MKSREEEFTCTICGNQEESERWLCSGCGAWFCEHCWGGCDDHDYSYEEYFCRNCRRKNHGGK